MAPLGTHTYDNLYLRFNNYYFISRGLYDYLARRKRNNIQRHPLNELLIIPNQFAIVKRSDRSGKWQNLR